MSDTSAAQKIGAAAPSPRLASGTRGIVIAAIALLTLVDLFAVQAILPALTNRYRTTPGTMGVAVNACTFGMAVGGLGVAALAMRLERRTAIAASLALLAVPTALLAHAPDLATFAALRVVQGIFMSTAFTLTLVHLGESFSSIDTAMASAAYISGNVASNLVGRLTSALLADTVGLEWNFYAFAGLNLAGAGLCAIVIRSMPDPNKLSRPGGHTLPLPTVSDRVKLLATCAIGFCILFAFIGTFSYVNFVLSRPPFSIPSMHIGLVYLVFVPSLMTTPLASRLAAYSGASSALRWSLGAACAGLWLLVSDSLLAVLAGLALVGAGTFMAQAIATGHVARMMAINRSVASGLYLASYFLGGLAGAAVLGQVFDHLGWLACVAAVSACLLIAIALTGYLRSSV